MGANSPAHPFDPFTWRNIPSEPFTGSPRSVRLWQPAKSVTCLNAMRGRFKNNTCSCSHSGMVFGSKMLLSFLSLGHTKPSSSIVKGAGTVGSTKVPGPGEGTSMPSANWGGGIGEALDITPATSPTLRRRFASMMRRVNAYLP